MRILIIRHAEPNYEIDGLTTKGEVEARLLAERLAKEKIDDFYVSPYGRARQTAAPTLKKFGRDEVICDWLHEFGYPVTLPDGTESPIPWDRMPNEWTKEPGNLDFDTWGDTPTMRSGTIKEKYDHVAAELDALLAEHGYTRDGLVYRVDRANTDTIALFCHFGVEAVLLSHLLNIPPVCLWQGTVAQPSSVTIISTEEREKGTASFRMSTFGDVSHLTCNGEEPSFMARFCEIYDDFSQQH